MKNFVIKILLFAGLLGLAQVKSTNSNFLDREIVTGNTIFAGCWVLPETPELIYPANEYKVNRSSEWYLEPYMDWDDSSVCPAKSVSYEYEVYADSGLSLLIYRSELLSDSRISALGTPDGTYFWRVRAFDGINWSDWSSVWSLIVDFTAPSIPGNLHFDDPSLTCGDSINTALVTVDWDDSIDANGISGYDYYVDYQLIGGGRGTWSTFFTSSEYRGTLNPGLHRLKVRALDNMGNYSSWSSFCEITYDVSAPTVDLIFPIPGLTATSFQAVFSKDVKAEEATNPANYFLHNWPTFGGSGNLMGDAMITYNASTKTASVNFTSPGWYISPEQEWGVENIHDTAGNLLAVSPYSESSTPLVDPVTTASGIDSLWHNSPVTITFSCSDIGGSGCYKTFYRLDGGSFVEGTSVIISTGGEHTISFYSTDFAGNIEDIVDSGQTVKIDTLIPAVPTGLRYMSSNRQDTYTCGQSTQIQALISVWNEILGDTSFSHYEYTSFSPDGSVLVNEQVLHSPEFVNSFIPSSYGTFGYSVRAVDIAGNKSNWAISGKTITDSCQIIFSPTLQFFPEINKISEVIITDENQEFPITDPIQTIIPIDTLEPTQEVVSELISEPTPEPNTVLQPDPILEPILEPTPVPTPETITEPIPNPETSSESTDTPTIEPEIDLGDGEQAIQ